MLCSNESRRQLGEGRWSAPWVGVGKMVKASMARSWLGACLWPGVAWFVGAMAAVGGEPGHVAGRPARTAEPESGVFVARFEKGAVVPGTARRLGPRGSFFQSMVHPACTSVVFWGRAEGAEGFDIWVSQVDGSHCHRLTTDGQGNEGPFWFPDGRHVVYASTRPGSDNPPPVTVGSRQQRPSRIWMMDADGRNQRQLTFGPWIEGRPCVSPDGRTIVFCSNRSGGMNLWWTDPTGREPVQITRGDKKDWRPVFSPDGRYLAYFSDNTESGQRNLAILRWPDGAPRFPVALKPGEWIHGPYWRADGRSVLVHGYLMGSQVTNLYQVELTTGTVTPFPVAGFERSGHGSWDRAETVMAFDGQREAPAPSTERN